MSYIYEALKRAEDEREHGAVTVRTVARPLFVSAGTRWWVWALIGGLAVNAALLVALTIDRWSQPAHAPVPAPAAAVVVAPPPRVEAPRVEAPRPVPIVRERPAPRAEPRRDVATPAPRVIEPERPRPAPAPAPAVVTPEPVEPRVKIATTTPVAPAAPAPRAEPAPVESAPDLTLQVHVYSPVASERMVFIAGRRYVEGDAIDADTVL
ncbi:MAG: general secretion pathway protein GspB, partial [Candidatus Rokubacteria bacterium]|nr:general secretion pathway protein GspB [Candidatus Rokubacteria bacterium]